MTATFQAPHAETLVLASCLIDPVGADRACEILNPDDFLNPKNALIFASIQALVRERAACGPAEIIASTSRHGIDPAEILDLAQGTVGSHALAGPYAKSVLEASQLRRLALLCLDVAEVAQKAAHVEGSVLAVLDLLRDGLDAITAKFPGGGPVALGGAEPELLRRILSDEPTPKGAATGFRDVDDQLGGLRDGEMIVLAARPSVGKSLFACNIAENVAMAEEPVPVLIFSLEMSAAALYRRSLFGRARVSAEAALAGFASNEEKERLRIAHGQIRRAPIEVQATAAMTAQRVHAAARRFKAKHGRCLIVVDYLQLMKGEGKGRYEQVTNLSSAMKAIAVDLDVPVLVLCQLSRNAADVREIDGSTKPRRPMLSDLRDSGAIEQDADAVIFLARNISQEASHPVDVVIAKNRPGRCGDTQILFDVQGPRFCNFERTERFDGRS